jgi:hypothetical protein
VGCAYGTARKYHHPHDALTLQYSDYRLHQRVKESLAAKNSKSKLF